MTESDAERQSKIFPGKGGQDPEVQVDLTKETTEPVTEPKGKVYKSKRSKYKGKHEKK